MTKVISYEQALKEGARGWHFRNAAKWHKALADSSKGRAKERHYKMAKDLNSLAAKLEENGFA